MTNPKMMNSGRPRIKDDDYKTVDPRCVLSLLEYFPLNGKIIDPCSPTGSGITDTLKIAMRFAGKEVEGSSDAFSDHKCDWIVSNTPYKRPLVDQMLNHFINELKWGNVTTGIALLYRTNFDHASTRRIFFRFEPHYYGQIKMMFRPRWFEKHEGDKTPFHNFVWHIWLKEIASYNSDPIVMYSEGE
jgi:hypothetical protein